MTDLATIQELSAAGRHQDCLQACQNVLQANQEETYAYKYAGKSLLALGQFEKAQQCLAKAHQLDGSDPEIAKDIGNIFLNLGHQNTALQWYEKALESNNEYAPAINNLANLKRQSGHTQEAVDLFKRAIQADPQLIQAYVGAAASFLALGDLAQAESFAAQALAINENTPGINEILGIVFQNRSKPDQAIECYQKELGINPQASNSLLNLGLQLLQKGQVGAAVESLAKASTLAPSEQCSLLLAQAYQKLGQFKEAIVEYKKLDIDQAKNKMIPFNLGLCLLETSDNNGAIEAFKIAVQLDDIYVAAWGNLGNALQREGRSKEALQATQKVLHIEPDNHTAYMNLGGIYKDLGNLDQALAATLKSLELKPDNPGALNNLKGFINQLTIRTADTQRITKAYEILINSNNLSHYRIADIFTQTFLPTIQMAAKFDPIISTDNKALTDLAADWRLKKSLTLLIPTHQTIEYFLTRLRKELVGLAANQQKIPENLKELTEALASQCFMNEYIYAQSPKEEKLVNQLILASRASQDSFNQYLAIIACYTPIHQLDLNEGWLKSYPGNSKESKTLIHLQLEEPREEQRIKALVQCNSEIDDAVSLKVQDMYEENPYPRYRYSDHTEKSMSKPISNAIRNESGNKNLQFSDELTDNHSRPKVLIAGCGTGNQVINASRYKNAEITAIDLSTSSLAYAIRKAKFYEMNNVNFKKMDLLNVATLNEKFDVIECVGVLHHMEDPAKGLSALNQQLKPGGYVKLGLYSELARREIVEARNQIKRLDIKNTKAAIKEFRQQVLRGEFKELRNLHNLCIDFYSLSNCRDLCFHIQEHRYKAESLQELLKAEGLTFCGFLCSEADQKNYSQQFPSDIDKTSLQNWGEFEKQHPYTFMNMYQFWAHKPS